VSHLILSLNEERVAIYLLSFVGVSVAGLLEPPRQLYLCGLVRSHVFLSNMSSSHDHSGIVSKMYKGTIFLLSCTSQLRKEMNCVGVSLGFAFE